MSKPRRIQVSSRALGYPAQVRVYVYDTLEQLRAASERFNGVEVPRAAGITQAYPDANSGAVIAIVRLARDWLGTTIVSHEIHHAATAIYGASLPDDTTAAEVLTHHNEPFAHLYSDLFGRLVKALYRHGYYE